MQSAEHKLHLKSRISHNTCSECRADNQRSFVITTPWRYLHATGYLTWAKPRLSALRAGADSIEARQWKRDFVLALHRRISLKVPRNGRKQSDGYLERFGQFSRNMDVSYLRRFAQRGASCLDN